MLIRLSLPALMLALLSIPALAQNTPPLGADLNSACYLWEGQTKQVNALWGENPPERRFGDGRSRVVIADIKGPGVITMIHFAMPAAMKLNRDVVMRIYWDGEKTPSVQAPLVDFFCDPNGALERVESAMVNKKRGWNAYFPMPFAKSARIELSSDDPHYPSASWSNCPCYSYIIYRTLKKLPANAGYFHAQWKQQTILLGKEDYKVVGIDGGGQFIGWNATVRGVGSASSGYPVDENVKFYVDGEKEPSIEWQGLEDAFGFSYGFPKEANGFMYTGYQPYLGNGAAAYRFCLNDRISFSKSMQMAVGFGKNEGPMWRREFSKPQNLLQISSVAYWYQREPHKLFSPMPPAQDRRPVQFRTGTVGYKNTGETISINCGLPVGKDLEFAADGWDFSLRKGYTYEGWPGEVRHCWADKVELVFDIKCPKGSAGTLRLYLLDGDNFEGGREEFLSVAERKIGEFSNFQSGRWVDVPISAADTVRGYIHVVAKNLKQRSNAVVSRIKFITPNEQAN